MTPAEVRHAKAVLAATVYENPFIPCEPTEKQALFLAFTGQEGLYGGAAGGAKTHAAIMAGSQFLPVPGYRALLIRETVPQLRQQGGLIERALSWWGGQYWNDTRRTFTFPHADGPASTIAFGSMENENAKYQYDGAELDFIGVDELRHFSESQYTYLLTRLRGTNDAIPRRLRGFTNPGADWIRKRWSIQRPSAENGHGRAMQVFEVPPVVPGGAPARRVFVPAFLDENPHLLKNDPLYVEKLRAQDPVTRAQLERGDWWVQAAGNMFDRDKIRRIRRADAPEEFDALVRAWDFAATEPSEANKDPDWTHGTLLGLLNGRAIVLDLVSLRGRWFSVEDLLVRTTRSDGAEVGVVLPQDPAQAGKSQYERFVALLTKEVGAVTIYRYQPTRGQTKEVMARPVSSLADAGNLDIVEAPWTDDVIEELVPFPANSDEVHDDIVDTLSAGLPRAAWLAQRLGGRKVRRGVPRVVASDMVEAGPPRRPKRPKRPNTQESPT